MAFIIELGGIMLAAVILASLGITAVILVVGIAVGKLQVRRAAAVSGAPSNSQSTRPLATSLFSSAALKGLLSPGEFKSLPAEFAAAVEGRVNDLIRLVAEAHAALAAGGAGALDTAARKIVEGRRLTGREWRKYLAGSGTAAREGTRMFEAFQKDAKPLVSEIGRLLGARSIAPIVRREEGYMLACAACEESAVSFRPHGSGFCARNISNVNQTICWDGESGKQLGDLLAAGSTRALLDYFAAPDGARCPAYCPSCDQVYCSAHYAVSEEWSGSWYSAGYATWVLGHEREYE